MKLFRENHKIEVRKLKDELESVPKEQKKDAYRQLKEEKDIQQAERVRTTAAASVLVYQCVSVIGCSSPNTCVKPA